MSTQTEEGFDIEAFEARLTELSSRKTKGKGALQIYVEQRPDIIPPYHVFKASKDSTLDKKANAALYCAHDEERIALAETLIKAWFNSDAFDAIIEVCEAYGGRHCEPLLFVLNNGQTELTIWCSVPSFNKVGADYDSMNMPPLLTVLGPTILIRQTFETLYAACPVPFTRHEHANGHTFFMPYSE